MPRRRKKRRNLQKKRIWKKSSLIMQKFMDFLLSVKMWTSKKKRLLILIW